jgi:hypothetical protein
MIFRKFLHLHGVSRASLSHFALVDAREMESQMVRITSDSSDSGTSPVGGAPGSFSRPNANRFCTFKGEDHLRKVVERSKPGKLVIESSERFFEGRCLLCDAPKWDSAAKSLASLDESGSKAVVFIASASA